MITSQSRSIRESCWPVSKSLLRRAMGAAPSPALRVRMGRRVLDLEKRVLIDPTNNSEEALAARRVRFARGVRQEIPTGRCSATGCWKRSRIASPNSFDRAIDLRINRLRRKIELDPAHPAAIRTVRGVGYMFVPPTD